MNQQNDETTLMTLKDMETVADNYVRRTAATEKEYQEQNQSKILTPGGTKKRITPAEIVAMNSLKADLWMVCLQICQRLDTLTATQIARLERLRKVEDKINDIVAREYEGDVNFPNTSEFSNEDTDEFE